MLSQPRYFLFPLKVMDSAMEASIASTGSVRERVHISFRGSSATGRASVKIAEAFVEETPTGINGSFRGN